MSKSTLPFNPSEYALVADRITAFYGQYPTGRIITRLVSRDRDVVFRAAAYRTAEDRVPAATGWASEREGNGEINMYACLENTETSAIGRALANLGFTASLKRPSREEMQKVERARQATQRGARSADVYPIASKPGNPARVAETAAPPPPTVPVALPPKDASTAREDLQQVLRDAEAAGFPPARAATIREVLAAFPPEDTKRIAALDAQLRRWIGEHRR